MVTTGGGEGDVVMAWVVSKEGEGVLQGSKRPEAGKALANMGG